MKPLEVIRTPKRVIGYYHGRSGDHTCWISMSGSTDCSCWDGMFGQFVCKHILSLATTIGVQVVSL